MRWPYHIVLLYRTRYGQVLQSCMKKSGFMHLFFRNISKTAETILFQKLGKTMWFGLQLGALRLKADGIWVHIDPKLRGGG